MVSTSPDPSDTCGPETCSLCDNAIAIQIADLFAGTRRRIAEGDVGLADLGVELDATSAVSPTAGLTTFLANLYRQRIRLF